MLVFEFLVPNSRAHSDCVDLAQAEKSRRDWINICRDFIFQFNMKKLFPLLLLFMSATASAEWVKINGAAGTSAEKFIDTETMRQTGPMNTMRRVWEISNLAKGAANKVLSIKSHVEYDCKDRRVRVLEDSYFSEHWAKGEDVAGMAPDIKSRDWSGIVKGSIHETIFNRVCPNDGS